ncbi:ABC transporter F family member 4-like [Vanessa cardui]|uniref:ABC transporter F family member 4-like n=1 Tax=Vanessa cardui TaxID=171605 RepID=UPI001F136E76|nr:ABC transporter F family member 4-like [Vanessa cardui]
MKSKSFELPKKATEKVIADKTYDFIHYYKPASENVKLVDKLKSDDVGNNETTSKNKTHVSKRERSPNKKKKKVKDENVNTSKINIDGNSLPHSSRREDDPKATSTPNVRGKKDINENVKSIMKNSSPTDKSFDAAKNASKNKPKKRNKSVSFMLDDTETVAIKRSKSELSVMDSKLEQNSKTNFGSSKTKKPKKKSKDGKENKVNANNFEVEIDASQENTKSDAVETCDMKDISSNENQNEDKLERKKNKRQKKPKQIDNSANPVTVNGTQADEATERKKKKKKHQTKQIKDKIDSDGEPASKSSKKDIKPDVIAQDLENLSIGDNAHTLTNLLDEMTVVDKKKKKHKKPKKNKQQNSSDNVSTETGETKAVEEKEKVKWMKRKWNKDRKGGVNDDKLITSIVVENLPLKIMCNYKKLLTEHFTTFGPIKVVGIAEVYSIEHPEAFTTTISFESEDAANKALDEDNTLFEGNRIRVKRPLPPSQTTLVVRSYADLSEPALSSVFTSAGRIRNVRRLVKGKKSMSTAFIEFDGPEAVERAIKMAEDVKIGGKKIFAAKFELRNKNKKLKIDKKNENDGGSDDSSD